jgi:hypothetical protein
MKDFVSYQEALELGFDEQKEFIPYQEALELNQLGFDKPCFGYWKLPTWLIEEKTRTDGYTHADQLCSAPTYSQAFRFFRKKYDLFGCIDLQACTPSHWFIRIDKIEINDYLYHSEDENVKYNTYEEAELACVRKLIEIVKKQKLSIIP